jgi:hypothetical protein
MIFPKWQIFIIMKYDKLKAIIQEVVADQNKAQQINNAIAVLNKLTFPVDDITLDKLATNLQSVGIKPVDILAAKGKQFDSNTQKQYLVTGPSAPGGGGHGALQDLTNMVKK